MTDCYVKNQDHGTHEALLKCGTWSRPERMEGTWARDFKFNEFYEGKVVAPEQAWRIPDPSVRLEVGDEVSAPKDTNGSPKATVSYVVFEGRRPLCDRASQIQWLFVDRMITQRIVQALPSVWYQKNAK